MAYPVLKTFIDKNTRKKHNKGSLYNASKERIEELQKKGFIGKQPLKKNQKVDKDESK